MMPGKINIFVLPAFFGIMRLITQLFLLEQCLLSQ